MKKVFTWIKPTADQIHIWNYFGAVKPLVDFQYEEWYQITAFVADMHALTAFHDAANLPRNIFNVLRAYIACWLDPDKVLIFKHSDVPAHAQLNWVLSCITHLGFMKRMHAYKDAINKWTSDEISMWTFNYPILMAADILLYDVNLVPVGKDQKQHVEFARDIAQKFNNLFGETFLLPEPYIRAEVATVPGMDGRKMSKSYNNFIGIFEDEKTILKKVKTITTDALPVEASKDPDKCNIYNIMKLFLTEDEDKTVRGRYLAGWFSYKEAKDLLYQKIIDFVKPIQAKKDECTDEYIANILKTWAEKANQIASQKIVEIYKKVGFTI